MRKKTKRITEEVEKRLDEIFVETDKSQDAAGAPSETGDNPLRELRGAILSIEWEISDDVMDRFLDEVASLRNSYDRNRVVILLLKMLDSLGRYIKKYKASANPGALKVLTSVYSGLEKVLSPTGPEDAEKEKILLAEVHRFKELKNDILQGGITAGEKASPEKVIGDLVEGRDVFLSELRTALEDIKAFIRSEFEQLRKELRFRAEDSSTPGAEVP